MSHDSKSVMLVLMQAKPFAICLAFVCHYSANFRKRLQRLGTISREVLGGRVGSFASWVWRCGDLDCQSRFVSHDCTCILFYWGSFSVLAIRHIRPPCAYWCWFLSRTAHCIGHRCVHLSLSFLLPYLWLLFGGRIIYWVSTDFWHVPNQIKSNQFLPHCTSVCVRCVVLCCAALSIGRRMTFPHIVRRGLLSLTPCVWN